MANSKCVCDVIKKNVPEERLLDVQQLLILSDDTIQVCNTLYTVYIPWITYEEIVLCRNSSSYSHYLQIIFLTSC